VDVTICEALAMDQPIVTLGRTPASNRNISGDSVCYVCFFRTFLFYFMYNL